MLGPYPWYDNHSPDDRMLGWIKFRRATPGEKDWTNNSIKYKMQVLHVLYTHVQGG